MEALAIPPLALYVHFPWCVRKCPYCDFNSHTLHGELAQGPYLARLGRDLAAQAPAVAGRTVQSVFLGGGTPSLFSPRSIQQVLALAREHLGLAPDAEVTLEANPGTIERGAFAEYRAAGVNRVSLGAQSFDGPTLTALGRIHSPQETRIAAQELHAAGLANFNLDLMYALPGQDVAAAVRDVEEALALAPAHLSHYQLTLEPGTVFAALPPPLPDDDVAAAMLGSCGERLAQAGFAQYEVSAYAQPGRQCRAQPQLLELRGLPRRGRRRARQDHVWRTRARSSARCSRASRGATSRPPTSSSCAAASRRANCRSSSCSTRCGCRAVLRAPPSRSAPAFPGARSRLRCRLRSSVGLSCAAKTGSSPPPWGCDS